MLHYRILGSVNYFPLIGAGEFGQLPDEKKFREAYNEKSQKHEEAHNVFAHVCLFPQRDGSAQHDSQADDANESDGC